MAIYILFGDVHSSYVVHERLQVLSLSYQKSPDTDK